MLRMDTWVQTVPDEPTKVATLPGHFFRHAGQDAASLSRLVKEHCVDYRSLYRTTAWASDVRRSSDDPFGGGAYTVLGWTSTAILRLNLSRRLDALNPVAAFRLLDQPEIAQIERCTTEYVVLRSRWGFGNEWPAEFTGGISGLDIDLWVAPGPTELDGAVALDIQTYLARFVGTEFTD